MIKFKDRKLTSNKNWNNSKDVQYKTNFHNKKT